MPRLRSSQDLLACSRCVQSRPRTVVQSSLRQETPHSPDREGGDRRRGATRGSCARQPERADRAKFLAADRAANLAQWRAAWVQPVDAIALGNSLTDDAHAGKDFHYCLSNPPFGVEWKTSQREVVKEHKQLGFNGRFGPGLPAVSPTTGAESQGVTTLGRSVCHVGASG